MDLQTDECETKNDLQNQTGIQGYHFDFVYYEYD